MGCAPSAVQVHSASIHNLPTIKAFKTLIVEKIEKAGGK
jgi:hypothetical protein